MKLQIIIFFIISIGITTKANSSSSDVYLDLVREHWNLYKIEFDKNYESVMEELLRFHVFTKNMMKILKHNQNYEFGRVSFKLGLNQFTDRFAHEINQWWTGFNVTGAEMDDIVPDTYYKRLQFILPENVHIPSEINWIEKGAVTPVKDQGQCGSCYAFATVGALEGQHYRATNELIELSEENIIDCSQTYNNYGCYGGWMVSSYKYIIDNGKLNTEDVYPYVGKSQTCKFMANGNGVVMKNYVEIKIGDEHQLMEAVATSGPVAIAIDASHDTFHMYSGGIYYEPDCEAGNVNHAVLIVGYGHDEQFGDYWLVKNSWSASWGDHGYIKMARNHDNNCCIACYASYPVV